MIRRGDYLKRELDRLLLVVERDDRGRDPLALANNVVRAVDAVVGQLADVNAALCPVVEDHERSGRDGIGHRARYLVADPVRLPEQLVRTGQQCLARDLNAALLVIELDHLDHDGVALTEDIHDVADAVVVDLGDVNAAIDRVAEIDERPRVDDLGHRGRDTSVDRVAGLKALVRVRRQRLDRQLGLVGWLGERGDQRAYPVPDFDHLIGVAEAAHPSQFSQRDEPFEAVAEIDEHSRFHQRSDSALDDAVDWVVGGKGGESHPLLHYRRLNVDRYGGRRIERLVGCRGYTADDRRPSGDGSGPRRPRPRWASQAHR